MKEKEKPAMSKLETAFENNNYDEFREILKTQSYGKHLIMSLLCLKPPTEIFKTADNSQISLFEKLLYSKEKKAGKYVSLILEHFELGHNETFVLQKKKSGETFMELLVYTETDEILFSYLMFDWFQLKSRNDKTYFLVLKNDQYFKKTGKHLIARLMEIIESSTTKTFLKQTAVRIIYQIIHEIELTYEKIINYQSKIKKIQNKKKTEKAGLAVLAKIEKKLKRLESQKKNLTDQVDLITNEQKASFIKDALRMKITVGIDDKEFFDKILMVLIVSLMDRKNKDYDTIKTDVITSIYTKNSREFFKLVFLLKENKVVEFQSSFEAWISTARKLSDVEFQMTFKLQVQLLSNICQVQKITKASEFMFEIYPHIGLNMTTISIVNSASDFQKYYNSEPPEVTKIVS